MFDLPDLAAAMEDACRPLTLAKLIRLLRRVRVTPAALAPYLVFDPAGYRRNPVAEGSHFEVKVLCWRAGQRSPIHDHAGSGCGVRVIRGVAAETVYDVSDPLCPRPVRTRRLVAGVVTAAFDRDAHRLTASNGDLVTLHVYAPRLHAMTLYPDPSGDPTSTDL